MKIRTNGIELNYSVEGNGPCIVMSHSIACNLGMWDAQVQALSRNYKVLRFDSRGHGASSAPEGQYTMEAMAEDVKGMLDGLGISKCIWVGLSMGGMIGQALAVRYPGLFSAMVLADTASRYGADVLPMWEARIKSVREQGMEPQVEPTLARWFTAGFRTKRPDVMARISEMIRTTPAIGFAGCCHAVPRINFTDGLKKVTCPTLVVIGDEDKSTPIEAAREIQNAISGAQLVTIASASHLSSVEQPEAFNKAVTEFLGKLNLQ